MNENKAVAHSKEEQLIHMLCITFSNDFEHKKANEDRTNRGGTHFRSP